MVDLSPLFQLEHLSLQGSHDFFLVLFEGFELCLEVVTDGKQLSFRVGSGSLLPKALELFTGSEARAEGERAKVFFLALAP